MAPSAVGVLVKTFGLEEGLKLFNGWYWSINRSFHWTCEIRIVEGRKRARLVRSEVEGENRRLPSGCPQIP